VWVFVGGGEERQEERREGGERWTGIVEVRCKDQQGSDGLLDSSS
jgi:hypothetical protein